MPIITVQNGDGTAVVRCTANEYFAVGGNVVSNSTVNTFVTATDAASNIFVTAVHIRKIVYSSNGVWSIGRVQNSTSNVIIFNLAYAGTIDLDGLGMATNGTLDFSTSNLYCNCSATGTLELKIKKDTTPSGEWTNQ